MKCDYQYIVSTPSLCTTGGGAFSLAASSEILTWWQYPSSQVRNTQEQMALMQGDRDQMAAIVAYTKAQTAAIIPLVAGIHQRMTMAPTQVAHGLKTISGRGA